ncbi:MAG: MFS transporter, partial [Actinomycetota bacterium]|nr:MFS transporter [Actinomycetota bacterium]
MKSLRSLLERRPVASSVAYTVVGVLPLYLTAAQAPRLQTELGFGKATFGLVIAAFYLVSSIASRRVGPRLDRLGPSSGLRSSAALTIASAGLIALFARDWRSMAVFLGIAGLGNAFGQVASNLVIASRVGSGRQGVAFAAKQAAVPAGAMLAGLAIPWVGTSVSWRPVYAIAAGLALILLLVAPSFPPTTVTGTKVPRRLTPELGAFMFAAAIGSGVGNSLASFVSDASVTQGFAEGTAALMLTVGSLAAIAARMGAGVTADRRQKTGVLELLVLLSVAVVGLGVLAAAGSSSVVFVLGV